MTDVTRILADLDGGDERAADRLLTAVYDELRRLAAAKLRRESPGLTLQATALVHEAYLRLVKGSNPSFENRAHFFASAAEAMRRILVERARRKARLKHGGGRKRVELDEADRVAPPVNVDLVALDEAPAKFEAEEPEKAKLVKLRYFAGLTIDQVAEIQGISRRTVVDHWAYARSWLAREVALGDQTSSG